MQDENDIEVVTFTDNQLGNLKRIASGILKPVNSSVVGRFFDWLDTNVLSKTTRLWMYFLEILGCAIIIYIVAIWNKGFNMIEAAQTELELQRAQMYIDAIRGGTTPIATMVSVICAAIPTVMGSFRSLKKKWSANGQLK